MRLNLEVCSWETFKCSTRRKYLWVIHTTGRHKTGRQRLYDSHPVKWCSCWKFRGKRPGLRASQVMFRTCPLVIQATGRTVVNLHLPTVSDWLYWAAKSKQCISVDGKERSLHVKKKKKVAAFIWNVAVGSVGAGLEEMTQENIHALCIYASRRKQVSVSHNLRHSLTFILVWGSQKKKNLSMSILQDAELAANKPPHNVTAHWEIWLPGFYLFFKLCIFKGFFQMNY